MLKLSSNIVLPSNRKLSIRQGTNSSTNIFKSRSNPSLHRLGDHPHSLKNHHINIGALQVADDLFLLSSIPSCAHTLVAEAQADTPRERFSFSKKKMRTMVLSSKKKTQPRKSQDIMLHGTKVQTANAEIHLGISRSSDGSTTLCMQVAW